MEFSVGNIYLHIKLLVLLTVIFMSWIIVIANLIKFLQWAFVRLYAPSNGLP